MVRKIYLEPNANEQLVLWTITAPVFLGFRAVGTEGAGGGAIALPDFGKYVNPILNSGGGWADYVDYITYCPYF